MTPRFSLPGVVLLRWVRSPAGHVAGGDFLELK
jgi:hypothetical protein